MKRTTLTNLEISQVCQELAVLLHAGVMLGDGLHLLAREEGGRTGELFASMGREVDGGAPLSAAMEKSGAFPS